MKQSSISNFSSSVLIIFSDQDNQETSTSKQRWVSSFKKFLGMMLSQIVDKKITILAKSNLDNSPLSEIENIHFLIMILSDSFFQSKKSVDMLTTIVEKMSHLHPNQIINVLKEPLSQKQPSCIRDLPSYDMFCFNKESQRVRNEYKIEKQYWNNMMEIAYNIGEKIALEELKKKYTKEEKEEKIYLAEVSHELLIEKKNLRRELQYMGYTILSADDHPLLQTEEAIKENVKKCKLFIHLINNNEYENTADNHRLLADTQNHIVTEQNMATADKTKKIMRLLWISPCSEEFKKDQKKMIENLERSIKMEDRVEVIHNSFEDFKAFVKKQLSTLSQKKEHMLINKKIVYLIYDQIDKLTITPYIEAIEKIGFAVATPIFEENFLTTRKKHVENLQKFDIAIIFTHKASSKWLQMKLLDLIKAPGFGRDKPILAKIVAITTPFDNSVINTIIERKKFNLMQGELKSLVKSITSYLSNLNGRINE